MNDLMSDVNEAQSMDIILRQKNVFSLLTQIMRWKPDQSLNILESKLSKDTVFLVVALEN